MGYTNNTFSSYFRRINSRTGREKLFGGATSAPKEILQEFLFYFQVVSFLPTHCTESIKSFSPLVRPSLTHLYSAAVNL